MKLGWSESIQGSCKSSEMVHMIGLILPDVGYDVNAVSITEVGHMVPPEVKDIRTAKGMLSGKASGNNKADKTSGFGNSVVVGDWNCQEKSKSSTWREVEAVKRVFSSNVESLRNKRVKILSDNRNVSSILQIGSRKSDLQRQALDMYEICKKGCIVICPEWIPGYQEKVTQQQIF